MSEQDTTPIEPFPEEKVRDHIRQAADAGLTAIPSVGGAVQILFDDVITPSLEKRRDAWHKKLGEVVEALRQRVDSLGSIAFADEEKFVSAVMQATRIAMGTHSEAKSTWRSRARATSLLGAFFALWMN